MKKLIVISAINLRSGGTLSILQDLLKYVDANMSISYEIIALVHSKKKINKTKNIRYIEFPNSVKSYLYRLYYEYFYFYKLSNKLNPYLWLSLQDISPRVNASIQAVYCHNPAPFYKPSKNIFFLDKKFFFQNLFYKFIYQINIKRNNFVIVQQNWLKKEFKKIFNIENVIVANPNINLTIYNNKKKKISKKKKIFFYPSFPRVFKNFEIICEAVSKIDKRYKDKFKVLITIRGDENKYTQMIYRNYKNLKNIKFIGQQTRKKVFEIYSNSDCLIFPSKLETWGLPISEFKLFNKPILAADLPYAHETIGNYDKVNFFKPDDANILSKYIEDYLEGKSIFIKHSITKYTRSKIVTWQQLFDFLLNIKARNNKK